MDTTWTSPGAGRGYRKPSQVLVFADAESPHVNKDKTLPAGAGSGMMGLDEEWALGYRHSVNFLAIDGHVSTREYIAPDDPLFMEAE